MESGISFSLGVPQLKQLLQHYRIYEDYIKSFSHTHSEYEFHPSMQACISPVNEWLCITLKPNVKWQNGTFLMYNCNLWFMHIAMRLEGITCFVNMILLCVLDKIKISKQTKNMGITSHVLILSVRVIISEL